MQKYSVRRIYWLHLRGNTLASSSQLTHLFRIISSSLGKRMIQVTVKEAVDAGFEIKLA